jgi:hypothetical protein
MTIDGREGVKIPKLDSLLKHAKRFKVISIHLPKMALKVGETKQEVHTCKQQCSTSPNPY